VPENTKAENDNWSLPTTLRISMLEKVLHKFTITITN